MKEIRVASRYAKALFDLAMERNELEAVMNDARLISDVCRSSREFLRMLRSPVIKPAVKKSVMHKVFENKVTQLTLQFVDIITRNGREALIEPIAEQFLVLYRKHKNILPVDVRSAAPLSEELKKKIVGLLTKESDADIELHESVDPDLIGGFVLEADDTQIDASVRRKLKDLERDFEVNPYEKGY
ncbi:MAG: ATP synthase F1 subunit delta [Bacteroidales bacterium]